MRPVSVFANGPRSEIEKLEAGLRGQWRQATRAVMVLLSLHALPPSQIAELLDCHPSTVRRWITRFSSEGLAGLADRPRCGRPRLGGRRLTSRITGLRPRAAVLWTPTSSAIGPRREVAGQRSNVPDMYLYLACTCADLSWVLATLPGGRHDLFPNLARTDLGAARVKGVFDQAT